MLCVQGESSPSWLEFDYTLVIPLSLAGDCPSWSRICNPLKNPRNNVRSQVINVMRNARGNAGRRIRWHEIADWIWIEMFFLKSLVHAKKMPPLAKGVAFCFCVDAFRTGGIAIPPGQSCDQNSFCEYFT
jgi:hypothetical protein